MATPDLDYPAPIAVDAVARTQLQRFYIDHHPWLLGWLRRRVGNSSDAADLSHDTFLCLLGEGRRDAIREARPFLATIARRLIARRRHKAALEAAYLEALACLPAPTAPSPESVALAVETLQQLDQALEGLPQAARSAFIMAHIEELTYAQVAERLRISSSTVKKYLIRANAHCLFALAA